MILDKETPKIGRRFLAPPRSPQRQARGIAFMLLLPLLLLHLLLCVTLAMRESRARWMPTSVGPAPGAPGGIPRIIHQMYKSKELPDQWKEVPATWASFHPAGEYRYMLWTDEDLRALIEKEYPWLLSTYDSYPFPTQRWDASRYAVLHRYGGLYADLDLHPVASIDSLLHGQTLLLPHTPNIGLTNAVMASTAGHPFMAHALQMLPRYASRWYHVSKHNTVLSSTGSTFVWALHMQWARSHPQEESASLLPAADWGKCSYCDYWRYGGPKSSTPAPPALRMPLIAAKQAVAAADPNASGAAADVKLGAAAPQERQLAWVAPASDGLWHSVLAHGEGSSWHSIDSLLLLIVFCQLDLLVVAAAAGAVLWRTRSRRHALATGVALLSLALLQRSLGVGLFELLIGRPWIWLIMS